MKLSYYHYYFKNRKSRSENPPRMSCDLRPILRNFMQMAGKGFPKSISGKDGETIFMAPTSKSNVYALIATRSQDLIRAVNMQKLTSVDIAERLQKDETAAFASYIAVSGEALGIASTLRGPRMSAVHEFLNDLVQRKLEQSKLEVHLQEVGSRTTSQEALRMARIARTTVCVSRKSELGERLTKFFGAEKNSDKVENITVIFKAQKKENIADTYSAVERASSGDGLEKLEIRAQHAEDSTMADYLIDRDSKFSEDIGTGPESYIVSAIHNQFNGNVVLDSYIENILTAHHYNNDHADIQALSRFADPAHWNNVFPVAE